MTGKTLSLDDIVLGVLVPVAPMSSTSYLVVSAIKKLILPPKWFIHIHTGTTLDVARRYLVKCALEDGATHILFLDSDIIPVYVDSVIKLLSWRLPIVSGVYYSKRMDGLCAYKYDSKSGKYKPIKLEDIPKGVRLVEVDAVGLGFCLIEAGVFEKIPEEEWFRWRLMPSTKKSRGGYILDNGRIDTSRRGISEDIYFCETLRKYGFKIFIDLGVPCRHIARVIIEPNGKIVPCI